MTTEIFGGELGSFLGSDSTVDEDTDAGTFNAGFARCAMVPNGAARYFSGTPANDYTDAWMHFEVRKSNTASGDSPLLYWFDNGGGPGIRINHNNSGDTLTAYYWDGAAYVSAGSATLILESALNDVDVHVTCNTASGSIDVYVGGSPLIQSATIDLSGITELKAFRFYGHNLLGTNLTTTVSQAVVSDEPTIGGRLMTYYASAAGSDSGWTSGNYTGIDEIVKNDADFIASTTADQVMMFAATAVGSITGYTLRAVAVTARAKKGGSGPENLQLGLRVGGANFFSSSYALDVGYTPIINTWELSPDTLAAWDNSELTGLQIGCKSIT